jgi:hypothetical protein
MEKNPRRSTIHPLNRTHLPKITKQTTHHPHNFISNSHSSRIWNLPLSHHHTKNRRSIY